MREIDLLLLICVSNLFQVLLDLHGHSRKKNIFMYGCSLPESNDADTSTCSGGSNSLDDLPHELFSESHSVKVHVQTFMSCSRFSNS